MAIEVILQNRYDTYPCGEQLSNRFKETEGSIDKGIDTGRVDIAIVL